MNEIIVLTECNDLPVIYRSDTYVEYTGLIPVF